MRTIAAAMMLALIAAGHAVVAHAQNGGTISGIVLDPSGRPIADADVYAFPEKARGRTDSAGKFSISKLDAGFYHVRVRRLGFRAAEITTDLAKNGRIDLKFELTPRPAMLDSVVVQADGKCAPMSYTGFVCRKKFGKGVYFTDDDIADKGAVELGELFVDLPGFRVQMRPTRFGVKPIPFSVRGGCINAMINGRPLALTNPLPQYATELIGVEIYSLPSTIPPEYQRYMWERGMRQSSGIAGRDHGDSPCALVVYWTSFR